MKPHLAPTLPDPGNAVATPRCWSWGEARWVLLALWCGVVAATAQLVVARAW